MVCLMAALRTLCHKATKVHQDFFVHPRGLESWWQRALLSTLAILFKVLNRIPPTAIIIFRFLKKVLDLSLNQEYRYEAKL